MTSRKTMAEEGIFGQAVFLTYDGLMAEGEGFLAAIDDFFQIVDFRYPSRGHLKYLPDNGGMHDTIFLRRVGVGEKSEDETKNKYCDLFGFIDHFTDIKKRPGFIGCALQLNARAEITEGHIDQLGNLYSRFESDVGKIKGSRIGVFKPSRGGKPLFPLEQGSPVVCKSSESNALSDDERLELTKLLDGAIGFSDTIIVSLNPNDKLPTLDSALTEEYTKKARAYRETVPRDRDSKFFRRGQAWGLGYPRPTPKDPEAFEAYLIKLMKEVVKSELKKQNPLKRPSKQKKPELGKLTARFLPSKKDPFAG